MMEQSIRELVERAKMGDQQAIAALYEKQAARRIIFPSSW